MVHTIQRLSINHFRWWHQYHSYASTRSRRNGFSNRWKTKWSIYEQILFFSDLIFFNYSSLESQTFWVGRDPPGPSSPTVKWLVHIGIGSRTLVLFYQLHNTFIKIKIYMLLYLWWDFLKTRVGRKNIKIDLYLQPGIITRKIPLLSIQLWKR